MRHKKSKKPPKVGPKIAWLCCTGVWHYDVGFMDVTLYSNEQAALDAHRRTKLGNLPVRVEVRLARKRAKKGAKK